MLLPGGRAVKIVSGRPAGFGQPAAQETPLRIGAGRLQRLFGYGLPSLRP